MQTVVSVLEDRETAQRAVERLIDSGFEPSHVHLQPGAAPANTAAATSPHPSPDAETGHERGVLSSIGHFFASLFNQDPLTGGYADRFAEAVRRGHPAIMVEATNDNEVDRASTILHELGAIDVDERIAQWRKEAGIDGGTISTADAIRQVKQSQRGHHRNVRVFQREPGRPIRDLFREHEERVAAGRSMVNRPASTEGESRVIDRSERERALASDLPRDENVSERDIEAREPKVNTPRRDL